MSDERFEESFVQSKSVTITNFTRLMPHCIYNDSRGHVGERRTQASPECQCIALIQFADFTVGRPPGADTRAWARSTPDVDFPRDDRSDLGHSIGRLVEEVKADLDFEGEISHRTFIIPPCPRV